MKIKTLLTGIFLIAGLIACGEGIPKRVTVVPHVIESIDTVERYNGSTMRHEKYYRYEFCDSTLPVTLCERTAVYKIGDTINYIYHEY